MENTLFYSKYCKHCLAFISKLKQRDLLDLFTKRICIDDPQFRNNLPPFLKEVPTIIIEDYDQPLASDMAFKWIEFKNKKVIEEKTGSSGIQDYSIGGSFDNAGLLNDGDESMAYQGLGSGYTRDGNSLIVYQESLLPPDMQTSANASTDNGDNSKREEKMMMARKMDDEINKTGSGRF